MAHVSLWVVQPVYPLAHVKMLVWRLLLHHIGWLCGYSHSWHAPDTWGDIDTLLID